MTLLVSREFSEAAEGWATRVYILLVKMMKCPNKDVPLCSILSQIKTLLGVLFPVISWEQSCRAEATHCDSKVNI